MNKEEMNKYFGDMPPFTKQDCEGCYEYRKLVEDYDKLVAENTDIECKYYDLQKEINQLKQEKEELINYLEAQIKVHKHNKNNFSKPSDKLVYLALIIEDKNILDILKRNSSTTFDLDSYYTFHVDDIDEADEEIFECKSDSEIIEDMIKGDKH